MIEYRDALRALIDPARTQRLPDGRQVPQITVIMLDYPDRPGAQGRRSLPAAFGLTPEQAREFADELLDYAQIAERRAGERR
jgi:hypothetical protein